MIWGIADQLVASSISLHREAVGGFGRPGIIAVTMDGVGALSVYHDRLLLCALRQGDLVTHTTRGLQSPMVFGRIIPAFADMARQIAMVIGVQDKSARIMRQLFDGWVNTVARICIGIRRMGTGGSLLITPDACLEVLDIGYRLPYRRLGDAMVLKLLDDKYLRRMQDQEYAAPRTMALSRQLTNEVSWARADAEDREDELTGAVKIVTSLAAADGLVLLDPLLVVTAFGVKIRAGGGVATVYDGAEFVRRGTRARRIDLSHFGTRHRSMLRYCRADPKAIGIVVSQDGHVRLIVSSGRSLTFWENVELLRRYHNVRGYSKELRRRRQYRDSHREKTVWGYTNTPKTIQALLEYRPVENWDE